MIITDFTHEHIESASRIARQNYEEARGFVHALPPMDTFPDISKFVNNNMGIVALDGDKMVGFLCAYSPFGNAFGTTGVLGTWSPLHAHAAIRENRANIYRRMYQAAAEKWVSAGAVSHSVTLYAHDLVAVDTIFAYGFGLRCIDTIRLLEHREIDESYYTFSELPRADTARTTLLRNGLTTHLGQSPCFLSYEPCNEEDTKRIVEYRNSRTFIISLRDDIIGYMELMEKGENFVCDTPDMMNICGAYLLPEYRGKGLFADLLH